MMKYIKVILAVSQHSLKEYCKNKLFAILIIFSLFSIYASLLVGIMAVDQEFRVLTDFGLGLMELMAFVYIVYISAISIVEEFKLKTIYLVLSRPVPKSAYLLGRIISLLALAAVILVFASSFQLILLKFRGFAYPPLYHKILLLIWMKLAIISSITVFLSFISTSVITTVIISIMLWTLGHFAPETKFLIEKTQGIAQIFLQFSYFLIPNFQIYNLKDYYDTGVSACNNNFNVITYLFAWIFVTFSLSSFIFRKKEF
ncbi:MAG: hypothetical protein U9Q34_07540 [Elusimicrobiota bacterium]|nr:hypothetical protein [Elusimicrobiota bacterium]